MEQVITDYPSGLGYKLEYLTSYLNITQEDPMSTQASRISLTMLEAKALALALQEGIQRMQEAG